MQAGAVAMKLTPIHRVTLSLPLTLEAPHVHDALLRVGGNDIATLPLGGNFAHGLVGDDQRQRVLVVDADGLDKLMRGGHVVVEVRE